MRRLLAGAALLVLSGCRPIESLRSFLGWSPGPPAPVPGGQPAPGVDFSRGRRELLAEMIRVVFQTEEVADDEFFEGLASSLSQGASLEGVYRGLIHGQRYRALEAGSGGADPAQIRFFASEMAALQETMKNPTRLDTPESRRLPTIEFPDEAPNAAEEKAPEPAPGPFSRTAVENQLLRDFIGASPFSLKRILGDEVLRKAEEIRGSPEDVAQWYAGTVLRLADRRVNFGLPLRNSTDFSLHVRFAREVSLDRVLWETLNRYHRCLNALSKK